MQRTVPSPTPTASPGIPGYRYGSYRPSSDKNGSNNTTAVPGPGTRIVTRTHLDVPLRTRQETEQNSMIHVQHSLVPAFEAISVDEDKFSRLYNLANSRLQYCKDAAPLSDLDASICLFREALNRRPAPHPLRSDSLKELSEALATRFSLTNHHQDLNQAIMFPVEIASEMLTSGEGQSHFNISTQYRVFATSLDQSETCEPREQAKATLVNFNRSAQLSDLNAAVMLHRKALQLLSNSDPKRPISLGSVAAALYARFRRTDDIQCLDEAISVLREAVMISLQSGACQADLLGNLSAAFVTRFNKTGQLHDLGQAMGRYREVLQVSNTYNGMDPNQSIVHAINLLDQWSQSGQSTDLETAISLLRNCIALLPAHHPNLLPASSNLATALVERFRHSGQREDLDEAILWHRKALELQPSPNPDRTRSLSDLATVLHTRFERWGEEGGLDEAISLHLDVLNMGPAAHLDRSGTIESLAVSLKTRFKQQGRCEDLDKAIFLHRHALHMRAHSDIDRSASMSNLAAALVTRFDHSGRREDLDEAILFHRDALKLRPAHHIDHAISLTNLASALDTRFGQLGQRKDLDEAISSHRKALELLPQGHRYRPDSLNNISVALATRFGQSGQDRDLEEAILFQRNALRLRPAPHPERPGSLINLAASLHKRFQKLHQPEDLDETIFLLRDGLKLCHAPHPLRSLFLNNLALTLKSQFDRSDRCEDLDEAISFYLNGLALLPAQHPDRSALLNNLGVSLCARFNKLGRREDLDEAISMSYQSISTLIKTHHSICEFSANLGTILLDAYACSHESEYLDKAVAAFRDAVKCETAPINIRFSASRAWAFSADVSCHGSALDAYHAAIELLPRMAMLGLDLRSRQQALTSGSDGLAGDAAACAIRSGHYDEAVELLEEARAVSWSQALQLRTPMADLREAAPELEKELKQISSELEQGSLRDVSRHISDTSQKVMSMEQEAAHFHDLNDEWISKLEEVRQLNGFQDFLRPKRFYTLRSAAVNGPIVILNTSMASLTSDALILTWSGVRHVPLPDLAFPVVHTLIKLIQTATKCSRGNNSLPKADQTRIEGLIQQIPTVSDSLHSTRLPIEDRHLKRVTSIPTQLDDIFRLVLAVLWKSVVEPIIRILGLQKSDDPSRLWWCPTGPFAFLPIHAAGMYHSEKMESVSDYVISSYTPTIGTLLRNGPLSPNPFKMIVIVQPQTPGQKPLPCTLDELQKIEARVTNKGLVVRLMPGYTQEVISHLPSTSIAHFACHAQQNAQNPLDSALILQDGELRLSRIMHQPMPGAALAFLSACETAMGDEQLPDEVIHLGTTLLFAGFQGVVATMWSISDADGPKVADTFYETLFGEGASTTVGGEDLGFDAARAAGALRLAIAKLRGDGVSFVRWVPFIHLGR